MAITETITKIQFRRGTTSEREAVVLSPGEPGWDTEQKILYVGDNNTLGGVPCIRFNTKEFDLTDPNGVSLIYNGLDYNTVINNIRSNSSAIATTSRLGIIKVGSGLAIDSNGKLDVSLGGSGSDDILPIASTNSTGIVSVPSSGGIIVDKNGAISIDESKIDDKLDFSKITYNKKAPPGALTGDMWYNTTSNPGTLYIWSGSEWVPISTASSGADGSDDSSSGGGTTTVTTVTDIINLAGGQAGNGDATIDIPVPGGDWLIHIQTQENGSDRDEDIVTVHSKKYSVPVGQYLWFKGTKTSLFKLVTGSPTPPSLGDSNWSRVELNNSTRGGGGNAVMGTIWGFGLKLESVSVSSSGGSGGGGGAVATYLQDPYTLLDVGYTYEGNDPIGFTAATTTWGTNRGIYQTFNIPTSVVPADATGILLRATTTSNDDNGVSCNTKVYIKTSKYGERMISHSFSVNNGDDSSGDVNSLIVPYTSSIDIKYDGKQNDAVISSAKVYIDGYLTGGGGSNGSGGGSIHTSKLDSNGGYTYFTNGMVMQWGKLTNVDLNQTFHKVTWPMAFKVGCDNVTASIHRSSAINGTVATVIRNITKTGCEIAGDHDTQVSTGHIYWQAIGRSDVVSDPGEGDQTPAPTPAPTPTPEPAQSSGGGWRHTEELTIDSDYGKQDITLDGIPRDATEVQIVLSEMYFPFNGAVYIGSQNETFTRYGGIWSTMFYNATWDNGVNASASARVKATPSNHRHAFLFAGKKYSSGVIRMTRSIGDRWFIEFNVQGYSYKLTHTKGSLNPGSDHPNIATVSKLFEDGLGKIYIMHTHTKNKYNLTHGFIRFSYR